MSSTHSTAHPELFHVKATSADELDWRERIEWEERVDNVWQSFKISLPLRDKIIEDILIALRDGYNNKHNECTNNRGDNNLNGEAKEGTIGNGRGSKSL